MDEDDLLTAEDLEKKTAESPQDCGTSAGARRKACKNYSCGLKEMLEEEDGKHVEGRHAHAHTSAHAHTRIRSARACTCTCTCIYTHAHAHAYTHMHMHTERTQAHAHASASARKRSTHARACTRTHARTHARTQAQAHVSAWQAHVSGHVSAGKRTQAHAHTCTSARHPRTAQRPPRARPMPADARGSPSVRMAAGHSQPPPSPRVATAAWAKRTAVPTAPTWASPPLLRVTRSSWPTQCSRAALRRHRTRRRCRWRRPRRAEW